jgi:hypothetical protein
MTTFDEQYPNIAWWVQDGRIEIGRDEYSDSFIRVIDEGGLIWESEQTYETVAEALDEVDAAIRRWADEQGL